MPQMPQRRRAFTLIELIVVVVIIAILTAIAIPQFRKTRDKAHTAAMSSDLKNLATAQEAYLGEKSSYASDVAQLQSFTWSRGVQLVEPITVVPGGWSARVQHPNVSPYTCAIFVGNAPPAAPATQDGVIACGP